MLRTTLFPQFKAHSGVSLIEMLLSLAIFSVIVFPMVIIPMKAMEQSEELKSQSTNNYEVNRMFADQLREDINRATRFFDMDMADDVILIRPSTGSGDQVSMSKRILMLAYWDEATRTEHRVLYALVPLVDESMEFHNPVRFRMMRAELPANAQLHEVFDMTSWQNPTAIGSSIKWKTIGQTVGSDEFYMTTADGPVAPVATVSEERKGPIFRFCRGANCTDPTITAKVADGVRVEAYTPNSGSSGDITVHYKETTLTLRPQYYKLGSRLKNPNRAFAANQIYPFNAVVKRWEPEELFLKAKLTPVPAADGIDYQTPVYSASETATSLAALKGPHFNTKSQELLMVGKSALTYSNNGFGLYIFKTLPGIPDYRPYRVSVAGGGSYYDGFPVVLNKKHPGFPGNWLASVTDAELLSVTQDNEDNVYVLARTAQSTTNTYEVIKFSPTGKYLSRFNITKAMDNTSGAIAVTYNPMFPNDVQVLVKNAGVVTIRTYPKDQNETDQERVQMSFESPNLVSFNTVVIGFPSGVNAMTYDPLHHRYLFAMSGPKIVSLPGNLDPATNPQEKVVFIENIYTPEESTGTANINKIPDFSSKLSGNINGLGYDPLRNILYITSPGIVGGVPTSIVGVSAVVPSRLLYKS